MTEAQIAAIKEHGESDAFDAQERAVLRFAEQLTREVKVDDHTIDELKGFLTDAQLVVLTAAVGTANLTNRFNEALQVELP